MSQTQFAIVLIVASVLAGLLLTIWQAVTCPGGWRIWLLDLICRLYTPTAFSQRIYERCPFPETGGALVIANHRSPVDPLFIHVAANHKRAGRRVRVIEFMTAREYCEVPGVVGWVMRAVRSVPVNRDGRDMSAVTEALRRLQEGSLVGVFPEGRINLEEGLLPGNTGVAWLAIKAQVPIYPVFIHDAPRAESMVGAFLTFGKVRVSFGDAIHLDEYAHQRPTTELLEEVTSMLMSRLAEMGGAEVPAVGDIPRRASVERC